MQITTWIAALIFLPSISCTEQCLKGSKMLIEQLGLYTTPGKEACNSPMCRKHIRMTYTHFPPYSLPVKKTTSIDDVDINNLDDLEAALKADDLGLLQDLSADIFHSCCPMCFNYTWYKNVSGELDLTTHAQKGDGDIFFPALGFTTDTKVRGINFLPVIPVPMTMFIYSKDRSPAALSKKLLLSGLEIWPLIVISLLMALFSGIIIWLLDTWFNVEEFPRFFFSGVMEGFWWAFVSMTTVGYGDRSPKSALARAFAVVWILTGIAVISMVTASMTSSITSVLLDEVPPLTGERIAVLSHRIFERQEVVKQNAIVVAYKNMEMAKEALLKGDVKGIITDNYAGLHYLGHVLKGIEGLKTHSYKAARENSAYGLLIPDDKLYEYCKSFIEYNKELIDLAMISFFKSKPNKQQAATLTSLFSTSSGYFVTGVTIIGILLGSFIVFGVTYEILRRHLNNKVKSRQAVDDDNQTETNTIQLNIRESDPLKDSLQEIEHKMQVNVSELIKRWESLIPQSK